jgi:hypothetical protein
MASTLAAPRAKTMANAFRCSRGELTGITIFFLVTRGWMPQASDVSPIPSDE